jgi:transcriptional regulator with XRE-family HTH domain
MNMAEKSVNPREIRLRLGLNQQEFWGRIGVTQSGGSRYESGRAMPKPVQELLRIVHVDQIDVRKITRGDFEVLAYLKNGDPTLYRRLKQQAQTAGRLRPSKRRHGFAAKL